MRKGNWRGTKHEQKFSNGCKWCWDSFECSREDAKTCSSGCRTALARNVRRFGFEPTERQRRPGLWFMFKTSKRPDRPFGEKK